MFLGIILSFLDLVLEISDKKLKINTVKNKHFPEICILFFLSLMNIPDPDPHLSIWIQIRAAFINSAPCGSGSETQVCYLYWNFLLKNVR